MNVQFLGQNSWIFQLSNKIIMVDPAMSANPLSKDIDLGDLIPDYILLTHAHGDHVADVEKYGKKDHTKIISTYEVASYYGEKGYKYHPMNHGGQWDFSFGRLAMVNAIHSSVFPDGTYGGNACGFVLMAEERCIYIAGDTALTLDMQLIPRLFPPLDIALLPIGDNFTMGIDHATIAAEFIECKNIVGCHYDTFPYIEIDHEEAERKFREKGLTLTLLQPGASITV